MGDARLGVNPDATPENKRLRRGGALSQIDKAVYAGLLFFLCIVAFFGAV
jgi:hypothetical protein